MAEPNSVERLRLFRLAERTLWAGPAVWLHLVPADGGTDAAWLAGQYVTVQVEIDGRTEMRSYSIASYDGELRLLVKKVDNGAVSRYLIDHAALGTELRLHAPKGGFTLPDLSGPLVLLGAGSGISPLLSLASAARKASRLTFLHHAARTDAELYFRDTFKAWSSDRFHYQAYRSEVGERITPAWLQVGILPALGIPPEEAVYMLCGPFNWMRSLRITLTFLGVPEGRIRIEQFAAPALPDTPIRQDFAGPCEAILHTDAGPKRFSIHLGEMVLPAAEQADLALPYSCRGGVCGSCRAICLQGQVAMRRNEVLAADDLAQGYFLTCTALPLTPELEFRLA